MSSTRFVVYLALLMLCATCAADVIFNNAVKNGLTNEGLATVARPAGGFYSEVQIPNQIGGYIADVASGAVGDDFQITKLGTYLDSIELFAYQPLAATPTINGGIVQILQGSENGQLLAVGTFRSSEFLDIYRIFNSTFNDNGRLQKVIFDLPHINLSPGNYFVAMQFTTQQGQASYVAPLTKVGAGSLPGANGLTFSATTSTWVTATDVAGPQEFPMILNGIIARGKLFAYEQTQRRLVELNVDTGQIIQNSGPHPTYPALKAFAFDPFSQRIMATDGSNLYAFSDFENLQLLGSHSPATNLTGLEFNGFSHQLFGIGNISGSEVHALVVNTLNGSAFSAFNLNVPIQQPLQLVFDSRTPRSHAISSFGQVFQLFHPSGPANFYNMLPSSTYGDFAFAHDLDRFYSVAEFGGVARFSSLTQPPTYITNLPFGTWTGLVYVNVETLVPNAYTILSGQIFGGNLASLANSDDDKLFLLFDESEPNGEILFEGTSNYRSSRYCSITVESQATRNDLTEFLQVYNWLGSNWIDLGSRSTTLIDSPVRKTAVPSSISIVSTSGVIRGRLRWIPQTDIEAFDGWLVSIDQILFQNTP